MKRIFRTAIALMLTAVVSCNSSEQKDANTSTGNSPVNTEDKQEPKTGSANVPADMENILGEWKLDRRLRDDNGNHKLDAEEEKTALSGVENQMKLNADGTCKFETVMDGHYTIVTEEDGRKRLAIKDLAGADYPLRLYVTSVSDKELVLNTVAGGSGFDVYKRP